MRVILYLFIAIFLTACAPKSHVDNYKVTEYFDKNTTYNIDEKWYEDYHQPYLTSLINLAQKNNVDLAISALNIAQAYTNVGLLSQDLIPSFLADFGTQTKRNIDTSSEFTSQYSTAIKTSYEIDLFGRIKDSVNAKEWITKANIFDFQNTKLIIINSLVDSYFKQLYLNDVVKFVDENLVIYQRLKSIMNDKFSFGKSEQIELRQIDQSIFALENKKLSYLSEITQNEQFMRNILNKNPEFQFNFKNLSLNSVRFQNVELNIPYYALSNRPDIRSSIAMINSGFYNYKMSQKNFYPTITIGASLQANTSSFGDSAKLNILGGNLQINLPFLNYARLKQSLKISEIEFDKYVLTHKKALSSALNELNFYYKNYELNKSKLVNLDKTLENNIKISEIYDSKYQSGKSELKDYLDAKNSEINARLSLLKGRYDSFKDEINIYRAMAGKFSTR